MEKNMPRYFQTFIIVIQKHICVLNVHKVQSLVMFQEDENSSPALLKTEWEIWKDQQNSSLKKLSFSLHLYFVSSLHKISGHVIPFLERSLFGLLYVLLFVQDTLLVFYISYQTIFMASRPETDLNTSLIALAKMTCPSKTSISKLRARRITLMNKSLSPKLKCRMNAMTNFTTWQISKKVKVGVLLEPSEHVAGWHPSSCSGLGTSERSKIKLLPRSDKVKKFSVPWFFRGWGLIPNCSLKLQALWFAYCEWSSLKHLFLNPVDDHIFKKAKLRTDFGICSIHKQPLIYTALIPVS